jgi:hypothetical protein
MRPSNGAACHAVSVRVDLNVIAGLDKPRSGFCARRICSAGVKVPLTPRTASREALFALGRNEKIGSFVEQHGMRLGAAQFVAGPTIEDGMTTGRALERAGFGTYLIELGEDVVARTDVDRAVDDYLLSAGAARPRNAQIDDLDQAQPSGDGVQQ